MRAVCQLNLALFGNHPKKWGQNVKQISAVTILHRKIFYYIFLTEIQELYTFETNFYISKILEIFHQNFSESGKF